MQLSPGVRPANPQLVVRAKRTVYWRFRKVCPICGRNFTARNATAKTDTPACRQAYKRAKDMKKRLQAMKAAADKAAAALVRKKRSQKVKTKR